MEGGKDGPCASWLRQGLSDGVGIVYSGEGTCREDLQSGRGGYQYCQLAVESTKQARARFVTECASTQWARLRLL